MAYRKSHIKSKVRSIRPKKSVFKSKWFWICLAILILAAAIIYFLFFSRFFQVKNIIVSGAESTSQAEIEKMAYDGFNPFSKSIFLFDTGVLEKNISAKFPGINGIKAEKKLPATIAISISERERVAIFCPSAGGDCYFIDGTGVAFGKAPAASEALFIVRQYIDNGQVFVGEKVIGQELINFILRIEKELKDGFNIDLKEALLASPARLNVETSESWKIYFDVGSGYDPSLQLAKLDALVSGGLTQNERKNLYYIDLRPKDRAIICDNSECRWP